ncbi:acyl-CoA synthetase [Spelaeicoccus albus]|uniref:Fatty-acyl-CoA synthase n=1 Tax=Spelaeicoccus albus TaxID=1280376 RepID=A0A7Z0A9L1_9MICO|nr:long-chain fatty acid--CoA ligase [Spelaeicoccus albus]NYI66919.1 fatty-acyl-CoA synthase [Spelaeicoccus albus]
MKNFGVGSWLRRRRPKTGDSAALVTDEATLTYAQLSDRGDRLADAMATRGIGKGDRVAYLGENDPAFVETFFACGVLGAIFVPLNTRLAPPEIRFQLQDADVRLLVHSRALRELAISSAKETEVERRLAVGDDEPASGVTRRPESDGEETRRSEAELSEEDYEETLAGGELTARDVAVGLDDGAMILYTSGTTGRPKGALLTHGNITWNCMNVIVDMDVNRHDVALMISPLFHVASLDMGLLPMLLKGATVVLESKFVPERVLEHIERYKVTSLNGVPTTYQLLCEHPDWATTDISSLNKLTCGGSAVPMYVLEAYEARGLGFSNGYGMTETAPGATTLPPWRSREKAGSAGLPQFFTDIRIADPMGEVLPAGEVGEIQIQGPNVIREYWNRPDASAAAIADGEWFRSGDMGYVDDDGFLFVSDRLKDMIISGGENIYPAEVEMVIIELEAVADVAVIGVPDEKWGEVPRAVVTVRDGASLTEEELRGHLDGRLARYKIPKSLVIVEELPRTASGKIRKSDLRRDYSGD